MKILAFGEILWDIFGGEQKLGGAPLNFITHCTRLGAQTQIISAVGKDTLGKQALDMVKMSGVGTDYIETLKKIPTGYCEVTLDENGKCLIWYVCTHEYYWFSYYLRHERYDRCCEILNTVFRFAMTDEYYMFERYHQRNIWFAPWSPNASANGRLILMLLDYYNASPEQELTLPS